MSSLNNKFPVSIESVAMGIRYQPNFELSERTGAIVDTVLRKSNSLFDHKVFPQSSRDHNFHRLHNPENNNYLLVGHQDTILSMEIDTDKSSEVIDLSSSFNAYILSALIRQLDQVDIVRYGVLFVFKECSDRITSSIKNRFVGNEFGDVRNMSINFTKRLPTTEAKVKKGVDNYRQIIYMFDENEDGQIRIAIDYQEIYKPNLNLNEFKRNDYPAFVTRGLHALDSESSKWLKQWTESEEAA